MFEMFDVNQNENHVTFCSYYLNHKKIDLPFHACQCPCQIHVTTKSMECFWTLNVHSICQTQNTDDLHFKFFTFSNLLRNMIERFCFYIKF